MRHGSSVRNRLRSNISSYFARQRPLPDGYDAGARCFAISLRGDAGAAWTRLCLLSDRAPSSTFRLIAALQVDRGDYTCNITSLFTNVIAMNTSEAESVIMEVLGAGIRSARTIRARGTIKGRNIELQRGKAYFKVAHDANRPFEVHANGTTFSTAGGE